MSKHTPGPWKLTEDYAVLAFNGSEVVLIAEASREANHSYKANAHLIAAAPEMLEALKACYGELVQNESANLEGGPMDKALKKAKKLAAMAISKAEGK